MRTLLTLVLLVLSHYTFSQNNNIVKKKFNWGNEGNDNAGYTQAVKVDNIIYISGTIGRGDVPTQLKSLYEGLEKTLTAYGASFQNVVKENLYTTDIEEVKKHNEVRKAFYKGDWPAATWVEIKRLYTASVSIEVELIAHLPK